MSATNFTPKVGLTLEAFSRVRKRTQCPGEKDRYSRVTYFVLTKNKEITQRLCLGYSFVAGLGLRGMEVVLCSVKCVKVPTRSHKDKLKFDGIKPQIRGRQWLNPRVLHIS